MTRGSESLLDERRESEGSPVYSSNHDDLYVCLSVCLFTPYLCKYATDPVHIWYEHTLGHGGVPFQRILSVPVIGHVPQALQSFSLLNPYQIIPFKPVSNYPL